MEPLEIRVLGELELFREGRRLGLPASKKTRALLGYLVVVGGRRQPRSRLCELFWEGPDDPRAGLRWSLTKLRPLIDEPAVKRLLADREHVTFDASGALVDLARLQDVGSPAIASIDRLRAAAALYRGELLEGLDLPDCYRYHEWCVAERERTRRLCGGILATLSDRLEASPDEALVYARSRVAIDPLSEAAHISVMRLLAKLGRPLEAIRQYESCRRILETQLGRTASRELEVVRATLGSAAATPRQHIETTRSGAAGAQTSAAAYTPERPPPELRAPLFGRSVERAAIAHALRDAGSGTWRRVMLFAGEPGIGKSRMLAETADQVVALGGTAVAGRAFEAEMVRPYGAWIDVLRALPRDAIDGSVRADLASLLPELGAGHGESDRNRLFEAVGKLLLYRAAIAPLFVALDDLQWFDEASAALVHFLARCLDGSRVVLACAARSAEIDGNPPVAALLRAMAREGRLVRFDLAPLDETGVNELVQCIDGNADPTKILKDGGGNPLFSIELARAAARGEDAGPVPTLDGLIADRLAKLDDRASELLPWAAALGHAFSVDALAAMTPLSVHDVLAALEQLERHGVLRINAAAPGGAGYDFAHDLVRKTAYRAISEPRRRWVHLHVARTLGAMADPEGALAGDVAHHAALGGDSELASRAYVVAGQRCLRLFALSDASRLAASGMQHAARLAPETGIPLRVGLLSLQVHSNQWLKRPQELEAELRRVTALAEQRGMHAEATRCHYLASFVHNERGDIAKARASSLEAAAAGRAADAATRQHQLANTGRCLALIERDIDRASGFLREAESLGSDFGARTRLELTFGEGLVRAFDGADAAAIPLLEAAASLAAAESDPWCESQALTRAARLTLEHGRPRETLERCERLEPLVTKLSEGSEKPFVDALRALARLALGEDHALASAEEALRALRAVDSKAHVAYVLNALAAHEASRGRDEVAERHAREALVAAEAVGQKSEAAVARSRLAKAAVDRGDRAEAERLLEPSTGEIEARLAMSGRARAALLEAVTALRTGSDGPPRST